MAIFVKTMSDSNVPDENNTKGFSIYVVPQGTSVEFDRDVAGKAVMLLPDTEGNANTVVPLGGNSYVMDGNRTVATFGANECHNKAQCDTATETLMKFSCFSKQSEDIRVKLALALCAFQSVPRNKGTRLREVALGFNILEEDLIELRAMFILNGFHEIMFNTCPPEKNIRDTVYLVGAVTLINGYGESLGTGGTFDRYRHKVALNTLNNLQTDWWLNLSPASREPFAKALSTFRAIPNDGKYHVCQVIIGERVPESFVNAIVATFTSLGFPVGVDATYPLDEDGSVYINYLSVEIYV